MRRLALVRAPVCAWADLGLAKDRRVEHGQVTAEIQLMKNVVSLGVDFDLDTIWEHSPQHRLVLDISRISDGKRCDHTYVSARAAITDEIERPDLA